ncbi:MAG: MFS transporter [Candidatus Rokubacteria bacterium]|nr:MFS transporter [Candidatus Rokubacteria bacterium]
MSAADLLREPTYRRLWVSGFLLNAARWMDMVTLGWLALQLTGSPFMVGLAAFARSLPMMLVGPFGGIIADRVPRGRVLVLTQTIGLVTALALATLFASGAGTYGALVGLEMVFGALWAFDFPARRTALYTILGAGRVAQAVSLETVSMQCAKILGPLAAGVCLARLGAGGCFGVIAFVYLAGLVVVTGIRGRLGGPGRAQSRPILTSLAIGLRVAWRSATVRATLLATIAINVLFFPYQHMLPVFARDVLLVGPVVLGALFAADGFGALAGALVIASHRGDFSHRALFAGAIVTGPLLLVGLSASPWLALCLALLVLMGVAESAFAAMQSTLVLLGSPEHSRGGVMGILSACIGTGPFGTLFIGFLTASVGVSLAFTVNALLSLAVLFPLAILLARRAG